MTTQGKEMENTKINRTRIKSLSTTIIKTIKNGAFKTVANTPKSFSPYRKTAPKPLRVSRCA
jgi:hypothetical protein